MKKILLGLFVGFVGIISFCSADSFSTSLRYLSSCEGNPVIYALQDNNICSTTNVSTSSCIYNEVRCDGGIKYFPNGLGVQGSITLKAGDYNVVCSSYPCSLTFTYGTPNPVVFDAPPPPLIPGGIEAITVFISNLAGTIIEISPYIVYVSIGVLGSLIGFVGIRWFINWFRKKITGSFKS